MTTEQRTGIRSEAWEGLKGSFRRMSIAITGEPVNIVTLQPLDDTLGKTDVYRNIYLNPHHPLICSRPEKEAVMMLKGVYAHEQMHQQLTDFSVFKRETEKKPEDEQETFHMICNIIEDPAIEYFASRYFGGKLLQALRFSIMQIYKASLPITEAGSLAEQFFNALIQYGDGGLIKGEFTFPEARRIFHECIPLIDRAIESIETEERVRYMDKVFELSRSIWEPEKEFVKWLQNQWKKNGRDHGNSSGFSNPGLKTKLGDPSSSKTQRRRKITFRRISKEEAEELMKRSVESGEIPPDADVEVLITDEPINAPNGGTPLTQGNAQKKAQNDEPDSTQSAGDKSESVGNGKPEDKEDGDADKDASESSASGTGGQTPEQGEGEISEDEYVLTENLLTEIAAEINEAISEAAAARQAKEKADSEIIDVQPFDTVYPGVKCENHKVKIEPSDTAETTYQKLRAPLNGLISLLTEQFKRIFRNDMEEREYRSSGKVSVKRLCSGKVTTRVFTRRKAPGNKSDLAVMMVVDESGSMEGENIATARNTAILLAEVFSALHIPLKVMGFTESGGIVHHYHYMSWHNTPAERLALQSIQARSANFDGYAVRYAAELISRRPEQHSLIIIISDGLPASAHYLSEQNQGIYDVRNAVQQASKHAKVLGILVGDESPDKHQYMYGRNLLHIENVSDLPTLLSKKIKQIIKG